MLEKKIIDTPKPERIIEAKGGIYTFLNPVSYLDAINNKNVFAEFDGIYVDGSILAAFMRMLYRVKIKRYSFDMTSVAPILFEYAEKQRKALYIVASKQDRLEKALAIIKQTYPNLIIVGARNGYFSSNEEMNKEILKICSIAPDFLIVGMGVIRQEEFLLKAKKCGFAGIGFTCGGFIHQLANEGLTYYPKWINKLNLRFMYRAYKEKHTRKRYMKALFLFPFFFIKERFFGN